MAGRISNHRGNRKPGRRAPALQSQKAEVVHANVQDGLAAAQTAADRGDGDAALHILARLREAFPNEQEPFFRASRLLTGAGRATEADRVLHDGQQRFDQNFGFMLGRAWLAHNCRDFAAAADRWTELRESFADSPSGYSGGAISFREAGRLDQAEALATAGMERFPDDLGLAIERAQVAQARRDFTTAAAHWDRAVERFPDQPAAYIGAARALRDANRSDEAEHRLRQAAGRFPDNAHVALEMAWTAQGRSDWNEAACRWQEVRNRFPEQEAGYLMGAGALRASGRLDEAEEVLAAAIERFPAQPRALTEYAAIASQKADNAEAVRRWEQVRAAFPDLPDGYALGAAALSALRREDDAEDLLSAAVERFPAAAQFRVEHAWIALRRQAWDAAEARFTALRETFPDDPSGYLGGASILGVTGRIDQAERLLEDAMRRLPKNPQVAFEHARLAVSHLRPRRDWKEALRRLKRLRARFPDFEPGYAGAITFARDGMMLDEADTLAKAAASRFPASPAIAVERAKVALGKEDWSEAAARFSQVSKAFPNESAGYLGMATALSRQGDFTAADRVLETAMARFPTEVAPFSEYGRVAARRNDWASALDRALAAQRRFPNAAELSRQVFEARLRVTESDEAALSTGDTNDNGEATVSDPCQLMMRFESLGGSGHGCEFGVLQRQFGAEPLGLLRWADLGSDSERLLDGLLNEFIGVGEPDQTELLVIGEENSEYWTQDRRYLMAMRAFVSVEEISRDKMFAQACRRLQYLRRKLLEDLREGKKIFVYKNMWRNLTDQEVDRLHAAMRRYGDNTLLYVRWEDAAHPNGTVELRRPGLMVGYIDHFAFSPQNESLGPATRSWFAICREAYRIWTGAGDAVQAAQ